jgi:4-amino-4-deoxy-L-arabinose transferase-like glycosyltransferase
MHDTRTLENRTLGTYGSPAAVFLTALAVRLTFHAIVAVSVDSDTAAYIRLGRNLAEHGVFSLSEGPPFVPSISYPPIYPAFVALLWSMGAHTPFAIAAVQTVVDATTAVMVLLLARQVLPARWALATALVYALHPGPIPYATRVLTDSLFTMLSCVGVVLFARALTRDRLALSAVAGTVIGLAALTRSVGALVPLALVGVVLAVRLPRRGAHAAAMLALAVLVIGSWCLRSSLLAGRFVPIQGRGVVNVYGPAKGDKGFSLPLTSKPADPRPATAPPPGTEAPQDRYYSRLKDARTPAEIAEADRAGLRVVARRLMENPELFLLSRITYPFLFLTSFDAFTQIHTSFGQLVAEGDVLRIATKLTMLVVFSLVPFVLAFVGLARGRRSPVERLCATIWIYTLVIHIPLWIEYRFWLPALPFLLVSAAVGAYALRMKKAPTAEEEVPSAERSAEC